MEAVVHLDRPAAMPSQSQMSYARTTGLHGRSSQQDRDVRSYKNSPQHIPVSSHNPGAYSSVPNYPMRYIHPAPYGGPPGAAPVPYRENLYTTSRNNPSLVERGGNVDYVRNEQIKQRISLLPTTEYLALPRNRLLQGESFRDPLGGPPPQSSETPLKKIRLGEPPKSDIQRNLRVDTRDDSQPAASYNPQVEAISPTLPSETLQDDANFRSTKDDLLHGIAKVDREITKTELQISKLKRKQQELEEASKKPATTTEEEEVPQPKHQSPAQKIYAENRKKAHDAHMLLAHLGPKVDLPLYNQPSDTPVYHENKKRHMAFKTRLLENLRKKHVERETREKHLTAVYSQLTQNWMKKVEKMENSQKRKAKEAKNREFFEKIFPKLRKQREDRERFNRVGARVKSEADIEEIMDGLQEQELEDKKMRSYAVVPPLLLDAKQRSVYYVNNNGRLEDFAADYKEKQLLNVWTQAEKETFKEKFLQTPKNFGNIAQYLEKKDVSDCVQYYYLSKKTENYKRVLLAIHESKRNEGKSRQRQRTRNPQSKVNSGAVANANLDILATASGVTTRLQREQLQKQEPLPTSVVPGCESHSSFLMDNPQPPPLLLPSEIKQDKKKDDKEEKKKKDEDDSTDDETIDPIGGDMENISGIACAICKTESVCSRALPRSQASQYGLKEEEVPLDARVCNLCRCKAVRSRFTNCPIPTCPNAKGHRVKRLRPLPCKWIDLAPSIKDPIASEFQIDDSVTKCCSVCFNRISRRIGVGMDIGGAVNDEGQLLNPTQCGIFLQWTEDDIESLKKAIKIHGLRWEQVSQTVGKSQHQCMNFYFTQQQKLGLNELLPEEKVTSEERKPVLTDEEESGSSTSSCDEVGTGGVADTVGDSDTASAPSPLTNQVNPEPLISDDGDKTRPLTITPPPPQIVDESRERISHPENTEHSQSTSSPQHKSSSASLPPTLYPAKEDYDSSATETADEGQGGGETEPSAVRASTPKREEDPSSPLTVKDLMLGVIEMQLMKNQGQVQPSSTPGGPPTISSILKSDHHSLSYNSQRDKSRSLDIGRDSLATVSVVNTHHTHQQMQEMPKEGLVVVQVQQAMREPPREAEGVTLDLSIKKPRESLCSQASKIQHQMSSQNTVFRVSQPPEQQGFFHQQVLPPPLGPKLSPGVISGSNTTTTSSKAQCGSIIHGTPVSSPNIYSQSRYDQSPSSALIHQVSSQHKESGSITQGTPVHQRGSMYPNPEYFQKRNMPTSAGYFSPRPSSYNVEQRQIIMNDYITSQQMHGPGNSSAPRTGRDKMYYQSNTRQGVIQRHNTKPPSPGVSHYPPGHEAFSSLVDVAVRQPSLPVPPSISMSHDHKNIQDEKRHLHEGLGERFNRDSPHERYTSRDSDRYIRDSISSKSHSQQPSSRDQQPSQQQTRESISHSSRESYQTSQLHMERDVQQHMQREHREREHHSQQSQKIRDSHISHHEMRMGRPPIPGYQPRLMHESHHQIDQRLIQNPSFREQPSSSQPSTTPSSRTHATQEQSTDSQSNRVRCPENSTLTAASLIDAIITHQINQSSEAQPTSVPSGTTTAPQVQPTRPGDRLFQSFHRECSESNGKLSPVKSSDSSKSHPVPPQTMQAQIIDHVEMYNNAAASQNIRSSSMYQGYDHQTWKLRRALQQKEDQGNVIEKTDEHMSRFYQEAPVPLSPLDYVKNRIAEVMRTSEEESGTGKDNESPGSGDVIQDEGEHGSSHPTSHSTGHPTSHSSGHSTSHSTGHPTSHSTGHPNSHSTGHPSSHSTGHQSSHSTGHPTSHSTGHPTSHSTGHPTSHSTGHPTSHSTGHPTSHSTVHPTSHSVAHTTVHSAAPTFLSQSHTYAYPYSALSLNTSAPASVPIASVHPTTKTTESSIPEPAPLLSSQYEPLSDED